MNEAQMLNKFTENWVRQRAETMKSKFQERQGTMDDMEALYLLDVWTGEKAPDERRVTSPRGMMVVEASRSLLFTRRPVLEVPPSKVNRVSDETADAVEAYLYGAWDMMHLHHVCDLAEWYATCLGQGWIRVVYDPETPRGEYPLISAALDPRNIFYEPDPRSPYADREVAHWLQRTRREILYEWGTYPEGTDEELSNDDWLDTKVDYIDFWATEVIETEEEPEDADAEELPEGVLGRAFAAVKEFLQPEEAERPRTQGEPEDEREGDTGRNKRLKRVVVNGVLVGQEWLKEPVIVPGYERVPFYRWHGISTPLPGSDQALSVLYPIAGGKRTGGAQGIMATENELLGMQLRMVEQRAGAAAITNADDLADLDASPGAINVTNERDFRLEWTVPPGVPPDIGAFQHQLTDLAEQATVPGVLMGQYQVAMSGVALSTITNPVLMRIAAKQREREEVLQELNKGILSLTEEYAPRRGWTVWGRDERGSEHEARLEPARIAGYRRNRVHLSARLPKDIPSEVLALSNVVDRKILSRRTAIERIQQVWDLAGQSPSDEMKRILVEDILMGQEATRKAMAQMALQEYDAVLAAELLAQEQAEMQAQMPPQAPPGGPPQGGPPMGGPPQGGAPMGQGPMMGMPPGAMPPQAPGGMEAVGGQDLQAMLNMMGQQGPPPGTGGRPPGR